MTMSRTAVVVVGVVVAVVAVDLVALLLMK
jgi:hypothetical protein